mmetsp:Transcript_65/g.159  ORF Transcript_65/g.159 Transcript_65/m.159 type:complete len:220 (+) Transcript_65:1311-1970(+)
MDDRVGAGLSAPENDVILESAASHRFRQGVDRHEAGALVHRDGGLSHGRDENVVFDRDQPAPASHLEDRVSSVGGDHVKAPPIRIESFVFSAEEAAHAAGGLEFLANSLVVIDDVLPRGSVVDVVSLFPLSVEAPAEGRRVDAVVAAGLVKLAEGIHVHPVATGSFVPIYQNQRGLGILGENRVHEGHAGRSSADHQIVAIQPLRLLTMVLVFFIAFLR